MTGCFNLAEVWNQCLRCCFNKSGLRSTVTDLKDGTVMHCWVPKTRNDSKPDLLLIHGIGINALWQWKDIIPHMIRYFNVYVPDLVFFGDSYTTRPERSESFQAQCVMKVMEANSVKKMSVVGLSYGGFVAYSIAAQFKDSIERVVICGAGVCMEEKDLRDGVFPISDLEEACKILVPQSPDKLIESVSFSFYKPPPVLSLVPSCLLVDFVRALCTDWEQKRDLIRAILEDRKMSNIPTISQPTLILWGEYDKIFPLELGHRLKRHLGDNAEFVVINNAGHVINVEQHKEYYKHLKSFLTDFQRLNKE